jgi:hypothetical protein
MGASFADYTPPFAESQSVFPFFSAVLSGEAGSSPDFTDFTQKVTDTPGRADLW